MYHIYKITNKINNKSYIGLTTQNIEDRWKQHYDSAYNQNHPDYNTPFKKAIRKYVKDNFTIKIIDEAFNLEQLKKLEQYWISYYRTYVGWIDCKGYNATIGGDAPTHPCRKVCKVNILTGEVEEKFNTIKEAEQVYSRGIFEIVHNQVIGQKPKGYTWIFEDELSNWNKELLLIKYRAICQLTSQGKLIKIWLSQEEAAQAIGTTQGNIWACLNNQRHSAASYQWCYYQDLSNRINKPIKEKSKEKSVGQYDLYDNLIQIWPSMSAAAIGTNTPISKISLVCHGKRKTSNGFKWKFI